MPHEYEFRLSVYDADVFLLLRTISDVWFSSRESSKHHAANDAAEKWDRRTSVRHVSYLKPHYRYRDGTWEIKRRITASAVYHDGTWFKWVHSHERAFRHWRSAEYAAFLDAAGNYQDPFTHETRRHVRLDGRACLYATRDDFCGRGVLTFEFEYGCYPRPVASFSKRDLLARLSVYRDVYAAMRPSRPVVTPVPWGSTSEHDEATSSYRPSGGATTPRVHRPQRNVFSERVTVKRKPVTCVDVLPTASGGRYLYAHKLDGVFGYVFGPGDDRLVEKWEGHERVLRRGFALGEGVVYAAEKLSVARTGDAGENRRTSAKLVVLLDVCSVRGLPVAAWSRRSVLTEYLPSLRLPEGYDVQRYFTSPGRMPRSGFLRRRTREVKRGGGRRRARNDEAEEGETRSHVDRLPVDGQIAHDVFEDAVYKTKPSHTLDLLYCDESFWFGRDGRTQRFDGCGGDDAGGNVDSLPPLCELQDGKVYEVAMDGRILRPRNDRFTGNTREQIERVLGCEAWRGPGAIGWCNKKKEQRPDGKRKLNFELKM